MKTSERAMGRFHERRTSLHDLLTALAIEFVYDQLHVGQLLLDLGGNEESFADDGQWTGELADTIGTLKHWPDDPVKATLKNIRHECEMLVKNNNGWISGYVDAAFHLLINATGQMEWTGPKGRELREFNCTRDMLLCLEIKPYPFVVADVIRQIKTYREFTKDAHWMVCTQSDGGADDNVKKVLINEGISLMWICDDPPRVWGW